MKRRGGDNPVTNPVHEYRQIRRKKVDHKAAEQSALSKRVRKMVEPFMPAHQLDAFCGLLDECYHFGADVRTLDMHRLRLEKELRGQIKDPLPQINSVASCTLCGWTCLYNEHPVPSWMHGELGITSNNAWYKEKDMVVVYHAQFPRFFMGACHPMCARICLGYAEKPVDSELTALLELTVDYVADMKERADQAVAKPTPSVNPIPEVTLTGFVDE